MIGHVRVKVSWGHSASTAIAPQQTMHQQQQIQQMRNIQMQHQQQPQMQQQMAFRQQQPQYYDPLRFMTLEESDERAFQEYERNLDMTELCQEADAPRNIMFAY